MKLKYFAVLLAGLVSGKAMAGFMSAQDLYAAIITVQTTTITSENSFYGGRAYGYVFAVYDTYEGLAVCAPDGTTGAQIMQVAQNYLGQHPESWSLPASVEVTKALTSVWPCRR